MKVRKLLKTINYKAGYQVRHEMIDGKVYGGDDTLMKSAYNPHGDYIGNTKFAHRLCVKRGIAPIVMSDGNNVCSIGFCNKNFKWYGWSHRAIFGFGVGHITKKGDCQASSGYTDEYVKEHPEELDKVIKVGFECKTLEDCKKVAIAFAASVS